MVDIGSFFFFETTDSFLFAGLFVFGPSTFFSISRSLDSLFFFFRFPF